MDLKSVANDVDVFLFVLQGRQCPQVEAMKRLLMSFYGFDVSSAYSMSVFDHDTPIVGCAC
jgi:hypothetical protein